MINPGLGTVHILLRRTGADSDTTNNLAIDHYRQATTNRTDTATHFSVDAECQLSGYVDRVIVVSSLFRW